MKVSKIDANSLAKLTGFTVRWLRDLASAGHIPKPVRGVYPHDETITRLFAYLRERTAASAMQQAKLEREQAKARKEKVAADLAEKKVVLLEEVRHDVVTCVMAWKFRLYDAAGQISAEAGMKLGLNSNQASTLRGIASRYHDNVIRDNYIGDLCAVICPHCEKEIKPDGYDSTYTQLEDLPLLYRDKERFAKTIEQLARNSQNTTHEINEKKKIMVLGKNGTWEELQTQSSGGNDSRAMGATQ